tara:strand:+ start:115 stop:972 length:858 start_codon:yes stop_codon:yes gene_type:complete
MWNGTEWIPSPPTSNQSVNLSNSVLSGGLNVNQNKQPSSGVVKSNNQQSSSVSISDSVITGDVIINQGLDLELINHINSEISKLKIDLNSLREISELKKKPKNILPSDSTEQINALTKLVMSNESNAQRNLLDYETYEKLSTIGSAVSSDDISFFNQGLANTSNNNEEWYKAAKRQAKRAWVIIQFKTYRTPEALSILLDIDEKMMEYNDYRIIGYWAYSGAIHATRGFAAGFNFWFLKRLFKRSRRKYDLEANNNPTLPLWSEFGDLREKSKTSKRLLKNRSIN